MGKKLKKSLIITLALIFTISAAPFSVSAFSDVSSDAQYYDALNRLTALGVISTTADKFNPAGTLTREQFAKMIVVAAGLEDTAAALKGSTQFPDISASAWSSGYINAALNSSYITGMLDGKFHPTDSITYAQICTILVRALGYTSTTDVPGTWPSNYIGKAASLGLSDGISLKSSDAVPRWAAVMMIDKMLSTNVSSTISGTTTKTFIETTGYYTKALILGNDETMDSLSDKQVLTNSGTYYNANNLPLEPGNTYYIAVKDATITKASGSIGKTKDISVDYIADKRVTYTLDNTTQSIVLPDNITYYYKGVVADVATVASAIQKSSSVVFTYNKAGTGYDYAMVFDPVTSNPQIAKGFAPATKTLGTFIFSNDSIIIKNDSIIDLSSIVDNDVVYAVTDIWGGNKYYQVYDDRVAGEITAVTPNKLSPKTLQIANVDYQFSQDIDVSKLTSTFGAFEVGKNILVYLGENSKIVNVEYFGAESNSDYALVLGSNVNTTTDANGTKTYEYYVKLMFSDGLTGTYKCGKSAADIIGRMVTYRFTDNETIAMTEVSYNAPGGVTINKSNRTLNDSYVADNVKIFNIVYDESGSELKAEVLDWSDLPDGALKDGKVLYTNTVGEFEDTNVILVDDIFNERYQLGTVKKVAVNTTDSSASYTYTILIGGKEYTYTKNISGATSGTVLKIKMCNTGISSIVSAVQASTIKAATYQALDSHRIKINDTIYFFHNTLSVYYKDSDGIITSKTLADLYDRDTYSQLTLYMNDITKKVEIIYMSE